MAKKEKTFQDYLEMVARAMKTGSRDKLQCCYYGCNGLDRARFTGRITEREYKTLETIIEAACSMLI